MMAQDVDETFSEAGFACRIIQADSVEITGGVETDGTLKVPATLVHDGQTYVIAAIADQAYRDSEIVTLDLSAATNLKSIGQSAFAECKKLESVIFPESDVTSLTKIAPLAFHHALALKEINLEDTHIEVLEPLFTENEDDEQFINGLKEIKLPSTLRVIRSYALQFLMITKIEIPSSVTTFEDRVLEGCINLKEFTWKGAQITSLPRYTFLGVCDFLERVTLLTVEPLEPTGLTDNHFFWCDKEVLQVILTPESIENLATAGYTNSNSIYSTLVAYEGGSDDPSAIGKEVTRATAIDNNAYYTLKGVRVDIPQKGGVYIHKGRKIVVK